MTANVLSAATLGLTSQVVTTSGNFFVVETVLNRVSLFRIHMQYAPDFFCFTDTKT